MNSEYFLISSTESSLSYATSAVTSQSYITVRSAYSRNGADVGPNMKMGRLRICNLLAFKELPTNAIASLRIR